MTSYGHVAEFIIYPASDDRTSDLFQISQVHSRAGQLFIVLAKWLMPPSKYHPANLLPDEIRNAKHDEEFRSFKEVWPRSVNADVEAAFRTLGLGMEIAAFLPSRQYCVWAHQEGARSTTARDLANERNDTKALLELCASLRAEKVKSETPGARLVFIHVGSLRSIRKMPLLVERRCNRPEFRFFTYGTHECFKPSSWGIREIFSIGKDLK